MNSIDQRTPLNLARPVSRAEKQIPYKTIESILRLAIQKIVDIGTIFNEGIFRQLVNEIHLVKESSAKQENVKKVMGTLVHLKKNSQKTSLHDNLDKIKAFFETSVRCDEYINNPRRRSLELQSLLDSEIEWQRNVLAMLKSDPESFIDLSKSG